MARFWLSFFIVLSFPVLASAQVSIGETPAPVQYTVTPEVPGPNTSITIQVAGVGNFIGNSNIIWTLDGKVALQGVAANKFPFTTGAVGHTTTITVSIASHDYGTITNSWSFTPSLVNLVWEAQATVPPLYGGHTRYSAGSRLSVYAFPMVMQGGKRIADSSLSFQWKRDDEAQVDASGLGRSSFAFQGNQLKQGEEVSVDILSGNTPVAHSSVSIPVTTPQLLWYIRDPLRGVIYNAVLPSTYTMNGQELTVRAEPYYFARTGNNAGFNWSWTLNGSPTSGPNSGIGELTLRTQGGSQGNAVLNAALQNTNPTTFLQSAQNSMTIFFGSQKSSAFGI